jgi:hypothetical protein
MTLLFLALVFAHLIGDYPLQGDFLAKAKNHRAPIAGVPWSIALVSHAGIQGGLTALCTGSAAIGLAEACVHTVIDFGKNHGVFGAGDRAYAIDQALHVACKLAWVFAIAWS